ncbi:YdeI/OmpD-associated family protein [Pseudenhygromyxa sp. WMMC2535]|nr:YdeI/OmpD-associated family protein [Pseudenhygromyxa sp. WMMC2535]
MTPVDSKAFATPKALETWLRANHSRKQELWVRIYKKASGTPSISWEDCVVACLTWGWIDGVKRSLDEVSYLQRITPRRPKSGWSKKNRAHAERLIAERRMQPAGLLHVEAARADGRWERAYAGSADMELPEDFLRALDAQPAAKAFFATLRRAQIYSIYHQLHGAKRPETRARRMEKILAALAEGRALR